ncbi:MAG: hypothetical protein CSA20_08630 [Deltaproteobacteria bacterium]|nr:MAG: hypothetical protein CSA20_08630 [Deltaproteobacteria bacterium]
MRRLFFPLVLFSLTVTLALAGLFYLPYLSVRTKTILSFHEQQALLLGKAVEDIEEHFFTCRKALEYLAGQQSIVGLEAAGLTLITDFHAVRSSQLLAVLRTDAEGRILWNTAEDVYDTVSFSGDQGPFKDFLPKEKPGMSEVYTLNNRLVAVLTQPIFQNERFKGNISFLLPCESIARQHAESVKKESSSYIMLFSRSGKTIYAPETGVIGKDVSQYLDQDLVALQRTMWSRMQGTFTIDHDFVPGPASSPADRYGVYLPINLPGGKHWSILLVSPENDVLGAMASFRRQWLFVTAIVAFAVGILATGLTVTVSRRRKDRKKRRFEEQLVYLLENAPVGVLMVSPDGLISYANNSVAHMAGTGRGKDFINKQISCLIHPDDCRVVEERIRTSGTSSAKDVIDARIIQQDGDKEKRDAIFSVTPLRLGDEHQNIVIVQDVTEKRKVEEIQQRLATAVEQVREIVLIINTSGIIEYVNNAFCSVTGYSREECLGGSFRLLWSEKNDKLLLRHIFRIIASDSVWQGRVVTKKRNGTVFLGSTSVSPVKNREGQVTHYVTVQRDITQKVEFESRTRQAQKMEAIGTLAGGIAHDFNNILGAIIGFTDIALLQSDVGSDIHENLLHIRKGGKRAADLVQQILTFSRQSAEEKSPVLVAPLIKESLHFIRATLPSTIEIDIQIRDYDNKVMAAPVQLQQIIMNLCTNASYAMRKEGGTLSVILESCMVEPDPGGEQKVSGQCLRLLVRDTGMGMDDKALERIFTPFFTTKAPGEGTGMGLSVVLGIVQDLGGEIKVESVMGEGSTFTVLLPLADESGQHEVKESDTDARLPTGYEKILVVDDEREIRETCAKMLRHFGYTVEITGNPRQVVSLIEDSDSPVELILTDQTMPGMTGVELIRQVIAVRPDIPVILCTGYSDAVNFEIALEAGAVDLMMKPFDFEELTRTVRAALDGIVAFHRIKR